MFFEIEHWPGLPLAAGHADNIVSLASLAALGCLLVAPTRDRFSATSSWWPSSAGTTMTLRRSMSLLRRGR